MRMTKTFTPIRFKNLPISNAPEHNNESDMETQKFYETIKPKLDELYKEPSEETIAKILAYANKKR